jgi:hypothetical protein
VVHGPPPPLRHAGCGSGVDDAPRDHDGEHRRSGAGERGGRTPRPGAGDPTVVDNEHTPTGNVVECPKGLGVRGQVTDGALRAHEGHAFEPGERRDAGRERVERMLACTSGTPSRARRVGV